MDKRRELSLNSVLTLGDTEYHIEGTLGKGSCAIMYKAWYMDNTVADARHHILIKELFPFDFKGGICRNTDNRIEVTDAAQNLYETYKQSFEKGNQIHLNILENFPEKNGVNINTYSCNNTLYTILGFGGGRDLETELMVNPEVSLLKIAERFTGILSALEEFHKMGYIHLDISPDNILLTGKNDDERVTLIDYNSVLSTDELSSECEICYSLKEGYTSPEVRLNRRNEISFSTDLYSVAAVFFRMIAGRVLTDFEMLRRFPPDVSNCKCIENEPETVKSQVRKILVKGLSQLPKKRYLSVSAMRKDFEELKERILGTGITHWSLWESGRRSVQETVRINTSYQFLTEQKNIYNLNVSIGDEIKNTEIFLKDILNGAPSAVLAGDGGMGKTTSLLNVAYNCNSKYISSAPAVVYISLYGATPKDENYIKDKLLENLKFKADTKTFEMARHKLKQILNETSSTNGLPAVVVLVDGFNEISENAQFITDEIKELSQNGGIRFVITTRQYNDEFNFDKAYLMPLKDSEVQKSLSHYGLLLPQNEEVLKLLNNPLMLSIFIEASKNSNGQLRINDKKELVAQYFCTIAKKGTENTEELWLNDVSVNYVLPSIAEEIRKKKRALNSQETFSVVKRCHKVLNSKIVFRAFPEWIGHISDILSGCKTAESWYDIVVRNILWKKTGLLSKNDNGQYRIFHQVIEEYLLDVNKCNAKKVRKRILIKNTAILLSVVTAFLAVCASLTVTFPELTDKSIFVRLKAIPEEKADTLLSDICVSYVNYGMIYETCELLLSNSSDKESTLNKFKYYNNAIDSASRRQSVELSKKQLEDVEKLGGIMPYSFEEVDITEGMVLLSKDVTDIDIYKRYMNLLPYAQGKNDTEYISAFKEFIKADAEYTATLFHYVVWQHIQELDENSVLKKTLLDSVSTVTQIEAVRKVIAEREQTIDSYTVTEYEEIKKNKYEKMEQIYGKYEILYSRR